MLPDDPFGCFAPRAHRGIDRGQPTVIPAAMDSVDHRIGRGGNGTGGHRLTNPVALYEFPLDSFAEPGFKLSENFLSQFFTFSFLPSDHARRGECPARRRAIAQRAHEGQVVDGPLARTIQVQNGLACRQLGPQAG